MLGLGTAMVYPTLLAAIGDVAHPAWRARSVGVYRLWRDCGFAVGALLAGVLADAFGLRSAIWVIAALTVASGLVVAVRMYETKRPHRIGAGRRRGLILDPGSQLRKRRSPASRWNRSTFRSCAAPVPRPPARKR